MSRVLVRSHRRRLHLAAVTVLLAIATACGSDGSTPGSGEQAQGITHVHGLGLTDDSLFVATHFGLWVQEDSEWSRRSSDQADHMGFSLVSERLMFRSGHPETGGNLGVERSTDGGRTWDKVADVLDSPVDFHAMVASRSQPVTLYGWSGGLYRAARDPGRWEPVRTSGLPQQVGGLALSDDGDLFATTSAGIFTSRNDGKDWEPFGDDVFPTFALATEDGKVLYASKGEEPGVQRSSDGGKSWKDVADAGSAPIVALAVRGETVVAADQTSDIWRSDDGGESWTKLPTP